MSEIDVQRTYLLGFFGSKNGAYFIWVSGMSGQPVVAEIKAQ